MVRRTHYRILLFGGLMILFIVLLQFLRVEKLYQLITPVSASEKKIELMGVKAEPGKGSELMVYIVEGINENEKKLQSNLQYALGYAKVNYTLVKTEAIATVTASPYHVLVLTSEISGRYPLPTITNFVQQGGRLVVTTRLEGNNWNSLVGIKENLGYYPGEVFGMNFEQPLFPGYPDISKEASLISNSIIDVTLQPQAKVYITAEKHPMLWTYMNGKGKVVYWNATSLDSKMLRGLLLHSIGLATPSFVSGQVAVKGVHIDDFPAPQPNGDSDIITKQFDMSISEFYKKIWWADMKSYAQRYDLKYTGYLIGTYRNDDTLDAGGLISLDEEPYLYYGRELLSMGGELGLHGYNHQPMVTKDEPIDLRLRYRVWDGSVQMEDGLKKMKTTFSHFFPDSQLKSYVPPSNIINRTGLDALYKVMPEINSIASVYTGDPKLGNLVQEFEFDEKNPEVYHMPRISSGYSFSEETQLLQADAIANFGMFEHFIHPDDLMDPKRIVGNGWGDMRTDFEKMFKHVQEAFPYLEALKSSDIREKLIAYQQAKLQIRYTDTSIYISGENMVLPSLFVVRVEDGKELDLTKASSGVEITKMKEATGLYLIKLTQPQVEIPIKG
jgi:hypothetical protein